VAIAALHAQHGLPRAAVIPLIILQNGAVAGMFATRNPFPSL
jgi:hypothetical protein